jgi:hypothetical protein
MAKHGAGSEKERSWKELIERQGQSGQSIRAFCASESISEANFHWWRRELTRRKADGKVGPRFTRRTRSVAEFVPVNLTSQALRPAIEIELPGGIVVRVLPGASSGQLREVLAALESNRC